MKKLIALVSLLFAFAFAQDSVVISPQSGVVVVRGMWNELRDVANYLKATQLSVDRQVILEAKIIEVQLNDSFQSGINWAAFSRGSGRVSAGRVAPGTVLRLERADSTIEEYIVQTVRDVSAYTHQVEFLRSAWDTQEQIVMVPKPRDDQRPAQRQQSYAEQSGGSRQPDLEGSYGHGEDDGEIPF